jgi:isopenicillin N synthase-like dioxygenase
MSAYTDLPRIPVIDLSLFDVGDPWRDHVAAQIDWAATEFGVFSLIGHGVEPVTGDALDDYIAALTGLAHKLMTTIGRGLRLGDNYFVDRYTGNPNTLLRIVDHSAERREDVAQEYMDYGLLTLVYCHDHAGLQFKHGSTWLDVPDVPGSIVCNVGNRLAQLTNGRYRSAPHRMSKGANGPRVSMPFFFDCSPEAIAPIVEHSFDAAAAA